MRLFKGGSLLTGENGPFYPGADTPAGREHDGIGSLGGACHGLKAGMSPILCTPYFLMKAATSSRHARISQPRHHTSASITPRLHLTIRIKLQVRMPLKAALTEVAPWSRSDSARYTLYEAGSPPGKTNFPKTWAQAASSRVQRYQSVHARKGCTARYATTAIAVTVIAVTSAWPSRCQRVDRHAAIGQKVGNFSNAPSVMIRR